MTPEVAFVYSEMGDWTALYINGKSVRQNHSLDAEEVLDALGIAYRTLVVDCEELGWGGMPDALADAEAVAEEGQ